MSSYYYDLIQSLPDIVYQLDNEGRFTYLNDAVEKLGYNSKDLIGKHFSIILHPDDVKNVHSDVVLPKYRDKKISDEDNPKLFDERRTGNRITRDLSLKLNPNKEIGKAGKFSEGDIISLGMYEKDVDIEEGYIGTIGIIRDVSDVKRSQSAIVQTEKYYRLLLQNISDIITILANDGTILYNSNSIEKNLGYDPFEMIGENVLDYIHSEDKDKLDNILGKGVEILSAEEHMEFRFRHKDGFWRYFETVITVVINDEGRLMCFVLNTHNITDRKKAEDALLNSEIELRKQAEKEKKEALIEAESARDTAEAASRAKSDFLSNISHELRTPLNSILGFSQFLEMQEKASLNDEQLEYIGYIRKSGEHLLEMVNDILDLTKIEAGKIEIRKEPFEINHMISHAVLSIKAVIDMKEFELVLNIHPDLGWIEADEVRIKQVIYNLVSNASKFSDKGKKIGIDAVVQNKRLIISVWDEGLGIAKDDLNRIFNTFEQVYDTEKIKPDGAGLGLPISKRLIDLHNGNITVDSSIGKGSRFTFELPGIMDSFKKGSLQKKQDKIEKDNFLSQKGKRILVVEDNKVNVTLMRTVLKSNGYDVSCADTGEEACQIVKENDPGFDLILVDIQLPGMNGEETMKKIRNKTDKKIPFIALTAHAMKGDRERFIKMGFDEYIPKPIDIKKFLAKINELLNSAS